VLVAFNVPGAVFAVIVIGRKGNTGRGNCDEDNSDRQSQNGGRIFIYEREPPCMFLFLIL